MDLLKENPSADFRYCALLSLGRHIRLPDGRRFIIGRNEKENNELAKAPEEEWFKIIPLAHPGPTSLMRRSEGKNTPEILRLACEIAARYSDCPEGEITRFIIKPEELTIACLPAEKHLCHRLLIRRH